jgi:alpha-mannosidase
MNTLHDLARFEVPGHKWADLSEPGFGVALLSDSKYGWSCAGNVLRMSLLRAPTNPDPEADQGRHVFAYAVMPHAGDWRAANVVAEAHAFNCPILWAKDGMDQHWRSLAGVGGPDGRPCSLVLDTIKLAEDSDALVLRLYEAHGARGTAKVTLGLPFTRARFANGLEEAGEAAVVKDGTIEVPYTPFQVVTVVVE